MFIVNGDMFGRYVKIPHGRSREKFIYKVVSKYKSNTYCDIPLDILSKPVPHDKEFNDLEDLEDVLNVIQCGIDESQVFTVALKDCELVEPRTNAEKIKGMSVEELAEFLFSIEELSEGYSIAIGNSKEMCSTLDVKEWLESECDSKC